MARPALLSSDFLCIRIMTVVGPVPVVVTHLAHWDFRVPTPVTYSFPSHSQHRGRSSLPPRISPTQSTKTQILSHPANSPLPPGSVVRLHSLYNDSDSLVARSHTTTSVQPTNPPPHFISCFTDDNTYLQTPKQPLTPRNMMDDASCEYRYRAYAHVPCPTWSAHDRLRPPPCQAHPAGASLSAES